MKKVLITTLGCKVNQYETAALKTAFTERGCTLVSKNEPADIIVINTCAVTNKAGVQSRQAIRQSLRNNPGARIVITGCFAETAGEQLAGIEELHGHEFTIMGNNLKDTLVDQVLDTSVPMPQLQIGTIMSATTICRLPVKEFGGRTRAYLRVQDGCQSFCTYCIVPYTRGPSRSVPLNDLYEQVKVFLDEGYKEIVLTGIHLGYYGEDLSEQLDITDLVDKITEDFPSIRFRISSLEPMEITTRLLTLMRERQNLMPHLHIPLQSGDDTILQMMERRYTTKEFQKVIEQCHEHVPDMAIGIDLLAGFPGETEDRFQNALSFLHSLQFTYLHVFPYSKRPGTKAADFPGQITSDIKKERVNSFRKLSDAKKVTFYREHIGRTMPVLVEGKRDERGFLRGFTDNYIEVRFPGDDHLINTVVNVLIKDYQPIFMTGEVTGQYEN